MLHEGQLVIQHHPASQEKPISLAFPGGVEVIGQVVGVAMRLDSRARNPLQSGAAG